jgi:L-serine dehydratase
MIVRQIDVPGVITKVTGILAENGINIAFMRVFRHGRREDAYMVIETDQSVPGEVTESIALSCPSIVQIRTV